jgi:hypothetical protein
LVKQRRLPASELLQDAVRAEVRRRELLAVGDKSTQTLALILGLREEGGLWPPRVPSAVLIECVQGHAGRDANENRLLKACAIVEVVPQALARRAALLRRLARRGSAVDALVVASAEPGDVVLTSDPADLEALAAHAEDVRVERV